MRTGQRKRTKLLVQGTRTLAQPKNIQYNPTINTMWRCKTGPGMVGLAGERGLGLPYWAGRARPTSLAVVGELKNSSLEN